MLKKSPAQLALRRCLKDFFPRTVESLLPIPENLKSGEVKDRLQVTDVGKRWSEHTKFLPKLQEGDTVQMQNLTGRHPLKSEDNGIIIGKNNVNSYSVKVHGSILVTVPNKVSLPKILPVVPVHN